MSETFEPSGEKSTLPKAAGRYPNKRRRLPFEVVINFLCRGRFDNLLDAMGSAKIAKRENPKYIVMVRDSNSDDTIVDIDS